MIGHDRSPASLHPDGGSDTTTIASDAEDDALVALLQCVAKGEVAALAVVYDRTITRVYGVALRMLRDPSIAQEATLHIYRQVWASAHLFDSRAGSVLAWLTTLTHRMAVQMMRVAPGQAVRNSFRDNLYSKGDGPRDAVALTYYGGMTCPEVADLLGEALPSVRSRLRAGVTKLGESVGNR